MAEAIQWRVVPAAEFGFSPAQVRQIASFMRCREGVQAKEGDPRST